MGTSIPHKDHNYAVDTAIHWYEDEVIYFDLRRVTGELKAQLQLTGRIFIGTGFTGRGEPQKIGCWSWTFLEENYYGSQ